MKQQPKLKINWIHIIIITMFILLISALLWYFFYGNSDELAVADLETLLENGRLKGHQVKFIKVDARRYPDIVEITGNFLLNNKYGRFKGILTASGFDDILRKKNAISSYLRISGFTGESFISKLLGNLITMIFFIGAMYGILHYTSKFTGMGTMNPFSMGRSKAKNQKSNTKFSDVAGIKEEKQELEEIVDYLKFPQKYAQMGARTPKGVLLVGPPGTGKTLLAKAVAGEAGVPFFSISGAEFEEVFVGVGASRVREMFNSAKKASPCIIFIDEVDAVGRKRSGTAGSSASEQTLNQLLVEMDGFEPNVGIIIIAATNRREVLDEALLRPGRFDREINLGLPDIKEREAILKLHARNKNISPRVSFAVIAERTPGFSGAQLENVLNEATLLAVRLNKTVIDLSEIDEAIDRTVAGPAKTSRVINERDKKIVSYHEAGHALIGLVERDASKVQKITIIPRGQAGGYTVVTNKEETMYHSKKQLYANITGFLGGRAAEEILFGNDEITTGAHDDLKKATDLARKMITEFGMSETLGLVYFQNPNDQYGLLNKPATSDKIINTIDKEIKNLLDICYVRAVKTIRENRDLLDLIANTLMKIETITAEQLEYIVKHNDYPPESGLSKNSSSVLATKIEEDTSNIKNDNDVENTDISDDNDIDVITVKPKQK